MLSHPMRTQAREILLIAVPIVLVSALAFWAAYQFVAPAPPSEITITSGSENGAYHKFAKAYAWHLAKSGIKVNILTSKGSLENVARLRNTNGVVDIALVQGGTANADSASGIVSLGRVFTEPLWVFYRSEEVVDALAVFKGKRLAIGAEGSGTQLLAVALLSRNDIGSANTALLPLGGKTGAKALLDRQVDAVFLVMAPDAELVQTLLKRN